MTGRDRESDYLGGFSAVQEVLDGSHLAAVADGETKLLRFMLRDDAECDLEVTPRTFIIRYSWHPSNHPYFPELAAGVVAQLMSWAQLRRVGDEHVGRIGPGESGRGAYHCSFGERWLWIRREDEAVHISIRRERPPGEDGRRFPAPLAYEHKGPVYARFSSPVICPHCGQGATELRDLGDAFVCPDCSRSFAKQTGASRDG